MISKSPCRFAVAVLGWFSCAVAEAQNETSSHIALIKMILGIFLGP